MCVLVAGGVDVARVLVAASRAQTAADAAALAAAQALAFPTEVPAADAASEYAARNGAMLRSCTCGSGSFDARIVVEVPVGPLLLFRDDAVVSAEARAVAELADG